MQLMQPCNPAKLPLPLFYTVRIITHMSRRFTLFCLCLLGISLQAAQPIKFDYLKVGSQTFSNVTVVNMNATDVYFTHDKGMSNVKLKYLEPEAQKKLEYDPKAADAAEKEHMQEDTKFKNSLAGQVATPKKGAVAEKRVTSEDSLADPISENSPLGKTAPDFSIDKWLGEKPDVKDKFVLLSFWATWSIPSKKAIPQLSALQKKFGQKLAVIAVATELQDDVEAMTDPKIDFASGVDTRGKSRFAFNITAIPSVVLIDPKGVVLYQGHPAALNEKQLEAILSKSN
jgi:cytochrome c biogenesis protein CcmG/thiol:disulfide interchange protein DsbE